MAALPGGAATKILLPSAVLAATAVVSSTFTDPTVLVAAFGAVGLAFTALVNGRSSRNKANIVTMQAEMVEARLRADVAAERADRAADMARKLDDDLRQMRVQLTHYQIGTIRLVDQLIQLNVDPVWRPETYS